MALAAGLVLAGCVGQHHRVDGGDVSRDCFIASSVRGFTPIDDTTVNLSVGIRDVYELKMLGYCRDIDWSHSIGVRTRTGSSMICTNDPMNVELLVPDSMHASGAERCRVHKIRKLSADEVAAQRVGKTYRRPDTSATDSQ